MADGDLIEIVQRFESLKKHSLSKAVKYVNGDPSLVAVIRRHVASQLHPQKFSPAVFQWLYHCVQLKQHSEDLYTFSLSFVPDLMLVYLHAVYENSTQLKANSEVLLLAMVLEAEKAKQPPIQVPVLSKPSLYHQSSAQVSQPSLTEAALLRHNQAEVPPPRLSFNGKEITVNNRLMFLSTLMDVFSDRMMLFSASTQTAFCTACVRLVMQGMGKLCIQQVSLEDNLDQDWTTNKDELSKMRRYSVNDALVSSLLRGVRMCMFQQCHATAVQALQALKTRAEYELLTSAIQASHSLMRMLEEIKPTELQLQFDKYADEGEFVTEPSKIHTYLNNHILHFKLSEGVGSPSVAQASGTQAEPHSVDKELASSGKPPSLSRITTV